MKILVLYRPNTERGSLAENYVSEFMRSRHQELQLLDIDSPEGSHLVDLYGITDNPAILVRRDDAQLVQMWQGETLPLINELAGYMNM